jgi:hypothetical protein
MMSVSLIPILCKVYLYGANLIVYADNGIATFKGVRFTTSAMEMLSEQLIRHGCID